jgi:hypothetical protein
LLLTLLVLWSLMSGVRLYAADAAYTPDVPLPHGFGTRDDEVRDAQESVWSSTVDEVLDLRPSLEFVPLSNSLEEGGAGRFGPFDAERFGYRWVEVHSNWTRPRPYEGELSVIVVTDGPAGRQGWQLRPKVDPESAWARRDLLHADESMNMSVEPRRVGAVVQATPDRGLPLFTLRYRVNGIGASTSWSDVTDLLVDVRTGHPVLRASLQRSWNEGGGACGVWGNYHNREATCAWSARERDFACTETELHPFAAWGPFSTRRRRQLLSGKDLPASTTLHTTNDEVARVIEAYFASSRPTGRLPPMRVRGLGRIHVLAVMPSDAGPPLALVAAAGICDALDARFFLMRRAVEGDADLRSIARAVKDDGRPCEDSPKPPVPERVGTEPVFAARHLVSGPPLDVYQVIVEDRGHKALRLIGIERGKGVTFAHAFDVASDAEVQAECGTFKVPGAIMAASDFKPPFSLAVATQRPFYDGGVHGDPEEPVFRIGDPPEATACLTPGRLSWRSGEGFHLEPQPGGAPCDHPQRPVSPKVTFDLFRAVGSGGPK